MGRMRTTRMLLLLSTLAVAALADEEAFQRVLSEFSAAAEHAFDPGAAARLMPALEALVASGDARAVAPIAALVPSALRREEKVRAEIKEIQKKGAKAFDEIRSIDKNLAELDLRERAGSTEVGAQIEQLKIERQQLDASFERAKLATEDRRRLLEQLAQVRNSAADAAAKVLGSVEAGTATATLQALRTTLDAVDPAQALFLVRILRASGQRAAVPVLLDILAHPKTSDAAKLAALQATAVLKTRKGTEALIEVWRRDPRALGLHAREALSMAAQKDLKTPSDAEAWASTLTD